MLSPPPHEQLKDIRDRLGITTRDVAELSHKIAEAEGNPEYQISNAWLTQVENSDSVPSIFKLYSLSSIYRIKFTDLLRIYGVDLQNLNRHQLAAPLPHTHLTSLEVYDSERTVSFPVRFDRSFDIDNTSLVARIVELCGRGPHRLDPAPGHQAQSVRLHWPAGFHALSSSAAGIFCADRFAGSQNQPAALAHRVRSRNLFCGAARWLCLLVVRLAGWALAAFASSAFAHQCAQAELWVRGRDCRAGNRSGYATDGCRRACCGRSKIAKASLTLDRNSEATVGFTFSGMATR